MHPTYVLYPTVLPSYRRQCIELLTQDLGPELALFASPAHLDPTVRTGIPEDAYQTTRLVRLGPAFIQFGGWRAALAAQTLVVDLNPRSLTAWIFILVRRVLRRRTLVWGHVHSRSGAGAKSAPVRRAIRRLTQGFIAYTPGQAGDAIADCPDRPVWVASNALFSRATLSAPSDDRERLDVLYVGRLVAEKRVADVVRAFARHRQDVRTTRLVLVGAGTEEQQLRDLTEELGVGDVVTFAGWIDDVDELRRIYSTAFCTVSPGFAGLGLTQSLGFGVPQLIADDQVHSPEIELAELPAAARWFEGGSIAAFADAITAAYDERSQVPVAHLREAVWNDYSAEAMASGLARAFRGEDGADVQDAVQ